MKSLFVTSEAAPYIASGGLGDVLGALPQEISKNNHEVSVILPLYDTIKGKYKKEFKWVCDLSFNLSWRNTGATVYKTLKDGVTYFFIENHYYFDRGRLYGEYDDSERFAFFSRAVIEFMLNCDYFPDILHANDWQSAPSIIYLKTEYARYGCLSSIKTVFTIHNIEYQGKYDPYILGDIFGLDYKYRNILEFDGNINLMKGAIVTSDHVTTVSPNYANELEHDFFAFGLSEIIKANRHKISGVLNGIDYAYFSPENGMDIYAPYSKNNYKSGKAKNKSELQRELGLPQSKKTPLIVMITRLASQKGIDLLLHIIEELLSLDLQLLVLGTGEEKYETAFKDVDSRHKNFKAILDFDRALSKKMYAAADMFLMPSKSEPCGLSQMIACSYGTVPIVRSVGGLYDTIKPYSEDGGNGFRFDNYNAHELLFTVKEAIEVYKNREEWNKLSKSAKSSLFTWDKSAKQYISIYNNLL